MTDLYADMLNKGSKDEDKEIQAIKEMNPEEVAEAIKILDEKIDGTLEDKETPAKESTETEPKAKDTSDDTKVEEGKKPEEEAEPEKEVEEKEKEKDKDFKLTEELISKQSEEDRGILNNYKDKSKDEIAQAVAHAVAMKSPYLKDNEEMIAQMKEQFLEKSGDELIKILVDVQREAGKSESQAALKPKVEPIEFPVIPENDPEIKKILEKETLKRLKIKYPNMPEVESMNSEEYKEFRRDLDVDNPDNEFRTHKTQAEEIVKEELSKVIYVQKNLPNLYEESPQEVLPLLTPETLPRLKALNDNPYGVLVEDLQTEIENIRKGLKKYGLTEADLGVDLTITKDDKGNPFNAVFNKLITVGTNEKGEAIPSNDIIGRRGKTFWLKPGALARKFREEYDDKILTEFVNKKTQGDRLQKDKVKEATLREASGRGSGGSKILTVEDIEKASPDQVKKIIADMEKN